MNLFFWKCKEEPLNGKCDHSKECDPLEDTQFIILALEQSKKELEEVKSGVEKKSQDVKEKADTIVRKSSEAKKP